MKLRKKTILIIGTALVLTLLAGGLFANRFFLESYRLLEQQNIQADITRFYQALDFEKDRLSALTHDWAAWDDTYQFMQDRNSSYITSNLSAATLDNLELNFMFFFTPEENIQFIRTLPLKDDSSFIPVSELETIAIAYPELTAPQDEFSAVAGILEMTDLPVLVASQPILTSQEEGPPMGRLVFGKVLTGGLLDHLQSMTGEEIIIERADAAALAGDQFDVLTDDQDQDNLLIRTNGIDSISATAPLRDIQGQIIFTMTVEKPRAIYQEGRYGTLRLGYSFVLAGLLVGGIALLLLEKGVLSKLSRLNTTLKEISLRGYSGQPLVIPGNDEISSLSSQMEAAFKELNRAHEDVNHHLEFQRMLVDLSTTLINLPISQIDTHIHKALRTIGEMAEADRCYVFLRREYEPKIVDNTHEWCRRGIKPFKSMLQGLDESSLPWWFKHLRRGDFIRVERVSDLPDEAAAEREHLMAQSIQSLAATPMQVGGQLIGFVGFDAVHRKKLFSERNMALLGIIGSMIANAVDRQIKEKQLVQGQQIQFQLNRITRASIAKENLRSTAITLSKELTGLIESEKCFLVLLGTNGIPDVFDSGKQRKRTRMDYQGFKEFLSTNQELIYINQDLHSEQAPEFFRQLGIRSCIAIPLISEKEVLGAAILADGRARQYSREEAVICQQAGPQITLAIQKVKALEAARRRTSELDALRATIADITSELEPNKLLRTMLERAVRLAHADGGEICMYDDARKALGVVASHNLDKDYSGTWMSIGEGAGGTAVRLKRTFIVQDYATWPGRMPAYDGVEFHATIVTPLIIGERILGTISLLHFNPKRQFSQDDQHILSLFAHHAAIAMENAMLFEKVHELARTDTVTGLLNRRALREIGDYEVTRAQRLDHPISVAMIDLDDFKIINDTYTHQIGDEFLKEVARMCRENIRNIDILSRYGGDEFVVIMPATNRKSALQVCQRLQRLMENTPIQINGNTFIITCSIGITSHLHNPPTLDELLVQADEAMYAAKTIGKNRICVFDSGRKGGMA